MKKHILFGAWSSSEAAPDVVDSGAGHCQSSKEGKPFQFFFRKAINQKILFGRLRQAKDKWFKRFPQHRPIFLSVLSEPSKSRTPAEAEHCGKARESVPCQVPPCVGQLV